MPIKPKVNILKDKIDQEIFQKKKVQVVKISKEKGTSPLTSQKFKIC